MRELTHFETTLISGARKTGSEREREKRCVDAIRGNIDGMMGSRNFREFVRDGLGALFGGARTIETNKDCQDVIRLSRQRDGIERDRHAESAYGRRGSGDRRERD